MPTPQAVIDALKEASPHAEVRCIDALAGCRLLFRGAYVWPYWAMVRYAPSVWRRLFAARLRRRPAQFARRRCRVRDAQPLVGPLGRFAPDQPPVGPHD